jgi:O-antigen/teichoic acid export membrane protein
MTGTLISQALPFVSAPLLTRLYLPNDFGTFALYTAVASLAAIIVTGRYEMAIVLPERDSDAFNVLVLALVISLGLSIAFASIIIVFGNAIVSLIHKPESTRWLFLIPFSAFLTGVYNSLTYWMNRKKRFPQISISRILLSFSIVSSTLAMGLFNGGAIGLIGGSLLGQTVASCYLIWYVWKEDDGYHNDISFRTMMSKAREYQDLPKINSVHALSDVVQSSGVSFLLSAYCGDVVLGLYAFSIRVVSAPLGIIGSSIAQVFYQRASQVYRDGKDLHGLYRATIRRLILFTLPLILLFTLFAPGLFLFVFGLKWAVAGRFAQLLAPWMFFNFIVSPVSQLPIILNKQKTMFLISLFGNSLILGSIFYGADIAQDISKGFIALSVLLSIYFTGLLVWYDKITKRDTVSTRNSVRHA